MNNEGNAAVGQQGQQQQSMQRAYNILIRAEQIQILPHLDQQQKQKLEQFVKSMYSKLASRPPESEEHKLAYKRLHEVTLKLRQDVNAWKVKLASQQGGPQSRIVGADQQLQRPQSQSSHAGSVQQQQPQQQSINASVFQHVQNYDYSLPPEVNPGSPEGEKILNSLKSSYLGFLTKQEQAVSRIKQLKALMDQRKAQGLDIPPEALTNKSQAETTYNQMKGFADEFQRKQLAWRRERQERQQKQNSGSNGSDAKRDNSIPFGNGQQHNQQQPRNQQGQGPEHIGGQRQLPSADTGENVRNTSNITQDSRNIDATSMDQQGQQQQQSLHQQIPSLQQQEQPTSMQQGQSQPRPVQQTYGQEGTFPMELSQNTSSVQMPSQQQRQPASHLQQRAFSQGQQPHFSNGQLQSPKTIPTSATSLIGHPPQAPLHQQEQQSATSGVGPLGGNNGTNGTNGAGIAGAGGTPVALTQSAALSAAARQYTDSRGGINASTGSSSYLQLGNREQNTNPKIAGATAIKQSEPIKHNINVSTPQPVVMGPARPTMAGPTSGGPIGLMGQPAIPKAPGFVLEGEGDRVLSKKKLDELVRQVTGSGVSDAEAGIGDGDGLTPEVENVSH